MRYDVRRSRGCVRTHVKRFPYSLLRYQEVIELVFHLYIYVIMDLLICFYQYFPFLKNVIFEYL